MQVIQRVAQVLLQHGCASILRTLFDTLIIINPDQSHQDRALSTSRPSGYRQDWF